MVIIASNNSVFGIRHAFDLILWDMVKALLVGLYSDLEW